MLKSSNPRNCKMTFIIGRGFAECQILKKWKWPYLLNWVEYFDKLLRKHWYWQDVAQEIANWHFYRSKLCRAPNSEKVKMALSLELWRILPSAKFWKSENGPIPWTEWNILINFCVNIDIDKILPKRLRTDILMVEALPSSKFWKSENGPIFWTVKNIVMKFFIHIDIDKM